MIRILHLTDLHLKDTKSPSEKLRIAFYEEYIDGLAKCAENKLQTNELDYIFCTGDFIDKARFENYPHAIDILKYIESRFRIEKNRIILCPGNHDYDQKIDGTGDSRSARKEYYDFEGNFTISDIIQKESLYALLKFGDDFILTLDSTYGANGENRPSTLSDIQIDEIVNIVGRKVPASSKLFVLSHYPMIVFSRSQQHLEEMGWVDKHLWKSGSVIVERIFNKREKSLTFWFCGDGHVPDFTSFNDYHHFLMTGMIGGDYTNPSFVDSGGSIRPYQKFSEAKIIVIDENDEIHINTFSYKSTGHIYSPHTGAWDMTSSKIRVESNPIAKHQARPAAVADTKDRKDGLTELMKTSVQNEILEIITSKSLYLFNRFSTSDDEVSLGWISIQRLFENKELLSRCVDKSIEWIKQDKKIDITDCLLFGVDFWGAVFASQISVRENIKNYVVATRHNGKRNVEFEKIDFLCERIKTHKESFFVIFTDVVATGNTVLKLKEKIESSLNETKKWIVISIISDKNQKRHEKFKEFFYVGTLCSDLILPILKRNELPDESILPIRFDLK